MRGTAAANAWATPTASWPTMASTTRSVSDGPHRRGELADLGHQGLVDREPAGGVEDDGVADLAPGRLDPEPPDLDHGRARRAR